MELIKEYWGLILAAFGTVIWFGRLESRAKVNTNEIERLEKRIMRQRQEDLETNKAHRDEMKETLKSIQDDIKLLLQRHSQ